jgi:hypothetical protein
METPMLVEASGSLTGFEAQSHRGGPLKCRRRRKNLGKLSLFRRKTHAPAVRETVVPTFRSAALAGVNKAAEFQTRSRRVVRDAGVEPAALKRRFLLYRLKDSSFFV